MHSDKEMKKLAFLIVDDEALIREGLHALLEREVFVKKILAASNASEFKEQLGLGIDVVLMDFRLQESNGLDLILYSKQRQPDIKIIAITGLEGTELVLNLLKVGVHGIVYKLAGYSEIVKTIKEVSENGSYFSDKIMDVIRENAHRWDGIPPVVLNFPEHELLMAIASGLTTKQIAGRLKMSPATAETYRIRLIKKVGVHNTAGLLAYAYRNGIL